MAKTKFKTVLDVDSSKYVSPSGTKLLAKYALKIDEKTGYEELVKTGEYTNVYDRIQADYPSTDINLLMERFALGDTEAINIKNGFYADVTDMPKNYAELFNMYEQAKVYFEELPTDLKEMFNKKSFNEKIEKYNKRFELSPEYDIVPNAEKGEE